MTSPRPPRLADAAEPALIDGEWHRLHRATPLLKGGIALVVVAGVIIANLRERLIDIFFNVPEYDGDPITRIYERGLAGWALLAVLVVVLIAVVAFYFSWRMHTFRVGSESVEVRSGILFRTHRKAKLDRIQGINVARPLFARIFGAAKLEVNVAGQDANVQLAYLRSDLADGLRRDILRLASGARTLPADATAEGAGLAEGAEAPGAEGVAGDGTARPGLVTRRVNEFLAPELDPDAAPPESVVTIPPGRLIASIVLSGFTIFLIVAIGVIVYGTSHGYYVLLFALLPGILGSAGYYFSRFTKSLRYSIAGTADGVRVGFGLLSTSNETIPPGRIHAIGVQQPLMWRPFGWWQVRINKAGHSSAQGAAGQANTTTLPVGTLDDVERVLALVAPSLSAEQRERLVRGALRSKGADEFTNAPRRAAWIRPFSWRRTGYFMTEGAVIVRRGVVWRELVIVPLARVQSVGIEQGPIKRALRLAAANVHVVAGPVSTRLGAIDAQLSARFFEDVASGAVEAAGADTSHHWGRAEASGPGSDVVSPPGSPLAAPSAPDAPARRDGSPE
ncbi:PH domain-containing protein [Compostimonas suwonensis]|uniref:Putative membrane protein n=1 Tax=Compostimonas suwonensis TaxID=1048394 RepID=A0A2M9C4Z0_9MICO|nr:PH domain-containing protein [Compostimonas suwonensis]PJJ65601.1 putative membrane protein [Compostimonas suwonensis]